MCMSFVLPQTRQCVCLRWDITVDCILFQNISLKWMSEDRINDKLALGLVRIYCKQSSNIHLNRCWRRLMTPSTFNRLRNAANRLIVMIRIFIVLVTHDLRQYHTDHQSVNELGKKNYMFCKVMNSKLNTMFAQLTQNLHDELPVI